MEDVNDKVIEKADGSRENDLSIDELQACPIFEHLSETQLTEVLSTLRQYTQIVFDCYQKYRSGIKD